jgi:hypothetical protein
MINTFVVGALRLGQVCGRTPVGRAWRIPAATLSSFDSTPSAGATEKISLFFSTESARTSWMRRE